MGRSYTVKVGTIIDMGRPYTVKEKFINRTQIVLKDIHFGPKKLLNWLFDLIARFSYGSRSLAVKPSIRIVL